MFKKEYLSWEEYKHRVDVLNEFLWRQKVRNSEIRNIA